MIATSPLRVAFDLTGLELDAAGSARAVTGLRDELERRGDVELLELAHRDSRPSGAQSRLLRGLHRELLYMPFQLPRRAALARAQLLHCPVAVAPVRSEVPLVITVHDVMAIEHPEWFTRANALQQRLVVPRALRRAARVLTPSRYTRGRLVETCDLDPATVDVVPNGVGKQFGPGPPSAGTLEALGVGGPYVLSVGTLQPRKNLGAAVRAFERIAGEGAQHALVIAGARGWRDEPALEALRQSTVRGRIHVLGRVSDDELVALYRGADCLIFPSLYEGFGLPALEAMACGTPVLCSNQTSLPEIVGDAALAVDPEDAEGLGEALQELLASPERRRELAEAGLARARQYSWRRSAELTVAAYRRVARD